MRFQRAPLSPRVEATGDVGRRVDVRLVLRNPTLRVRASERRLRTSRTEVAAGVARLTRVRRIHEPNRNPGVKGFVLDAPGETRERPVVESPIHLLAAVEMFTDVRQVFKNDYRILELSGVLDGLSRRLLHDVREGVLIVVESFVHAPLGVSLLKTAERREHLFAKVSGASAVVDVRLGWSPVPTGTARQEFGFANVEADRRRVVRFLGFRNLVLDGDVKHPIRPVFLQAELSDRDVAVEQVCPERFLSRIDAERNPEGVATPGLRDAPTELVRSVLRAVETPPSIREPNWMVVVQLRSVVRPAELRDVVLEGVFGVGRERVTGDDIVDRRLRVCAGVEGLREGAAVRRHGTLKPLLFVRRWWRERGFERFCGGGGHISTNEPMQVKTIVKLSSDTDAKSEHRGKRRTVRRTARSERRTRPDVERASATGRESVGHRGATVGREVACTNAIPPRGKRRGFLATAR